MLAMLISGPRRSRLKLLGFTFVLSLITFLDRVAIGGAAPAIRADLGLSPAQMGWAFSAFTFAYAAFEIPTGWLGDRFGPRKILTRIVLWWSAFTMATGAAWNFSSLVATRFLFGVGEAGPIRISRAVSRGGSPARSEESPTAWCSWAAGSAARRTAPRRPARRTGRLASGVPRVRSAGRRLVRVLVAVVPG